MRRTLLHLALLGFAPFIQAATLTVINIADDGPGSLRQAISSAAPGDTVNISATGTILLTGGELLVTKNVAIFGPGPTNAAVDGNAAGRVFHIAPSNTVSISGLTITNAFTETEFGGGIFNDHATLTVSNCVVSGNSALAGGSGIYNDGSSGSANVEIISSILSDNGTYLGDGGGVYNYGGDGGSATVRIVNSTLRDHVASYGGGIYNDGRSGRASAEIINSILSNSHAFVGGGIYNDGLGGTSTVQIVRGTLSGNIVEFNGGGIYNDHATLTIDNSTLNGNVAGQTSGGILNDGAGGASIVQIANSTLSGNEGGQVGGGILNYHATLTVSNSTLSGNEGGSGAGILNIGGVSGNSRVRIVNSTLSSNLAFWDGGIVNYGDGSSDSATVEIGSTILNADAPYENIFNDLGTVVSLGHNLSSDDASGLLTKVTDQINTDPMLGPLQDNGGPTFTHALLPGSPAIDRGGSAGPSTDQRGMLRPYDVPTVPNAGDGSDIGAYEWTAAPAIVAQPENQIVLVGQTATFSVTASGTPPFIYQWRKGNSPIGGAMATNYTISGVTTSDAGGYDVTVADSYGSITSAVATLTVVFPPSITDPPTNQTVAAGSMASFGVTAAGTEPKSYQWHNTTGPIPDATNSIFILNPALTNNAGEYFAIVTNPYGQLTSAVATLTVFVPACISTGPFSQVVAAHDTATFSVGAFGYPALSYQWRFNGVDVPGANNSSLVITNVGTNALGYYWVEVWNAYTSATSPPAALLMPPSLRVPFAGLVAVWGKEATLSVSAWGSGELSYQWYKDGQPIPGATTKKLVFPTVQVGDGGLYSVVVTSAYGSVTNRPAQLVINPANISLGLYAGITIEGVPGYTYGIEYTTDLTDTNSWQSLTNVTLTQPVELWVDRSINVHSPTSVKRFYRVTNQ